MKKVYDFADFVDAIRRSNSGNVVIKEMGCSDFSDWLDLSSRSKIAQTTPKPALADMVHVVFERGNRTLKYRNSFLDEFTTLDFLQARYLKAKTLPKPAVRQANRGVPAAKKRDILQKLGKVIPANRIGFWKDLPVSDASVDLAFEDDEEQESAD
jgi:hypothetical protein